MNVNTGTTRIDIGDWLDGLRAMAARGRDLRPVFKDFKSVVREDLDDHFEEGQGDDGPWAPRAPSSVERIMGLRGSTRKRGKQAGMPTKKGQARLDNQLGRLKSAWATKLTPTLLEFRSKVQWADAHMKGAIVGANNSRVPARPFAWLSDEVVEKFANITRDYIAEGW